MAMAFACLAYPACAGEAAVALRAEHWVVPPATGPVTHVVIENRQNTPYSGTVTLELPEGWVANRTRADVKIKPRGRARVAFALQKARANEANQYPVRVTATSAAGSLTRKQTVVCSSAPHYEPRVDGRATDWKDALPISFEHKGKRTTFATYWNRRHFYVLCQVAERKLLGYRKAAAPGAFDAVQFAVAQRDAVTPSDIAARAKRHEFLLVASRSWLGRDRCFRLLSVGDGMAAVRAERAIEGLECREAVVRVKRSRGITTYECAIPWAQLAPIRPLVGRELCFAIIVHDPDESGIRQWGAAAGLWPWQRGWLAWCSWKGVRWDEQPPFDGKIELGLCTSKY
ncbi:hypothetical protein HQ576_18860 [bacterium]|nr:hypothetical protein [bacterium]